MLQKIPLTSTHLVYKQTNLEGAYWLYMRYTCAKDVHGQRLIAFAHCQQASCSSDSALLCCSLRGNEIKPMADALVVG